MKPYYVFRTAHVVVEVNGWYYDPAWGTASPDPIGEPVWPHPLTMDHIGPGGTFESDFREKGETT